ncbi:MAG TPA: dockerin type I domain-containing protein, partial [Lacipirellulaceae bacterium]|nr:dockerin type I domain-containing protein [Lacipirellulaceae bacterium]
PGDQGWHPVNPAAANSLHPWGLPAFTDGLGSQGNFYGLLNDFPPLGSPTKLLQYDLPGPTDVTEINIFTGNILDTDGRVFSTVVIRYSANNGATFNPLGYFQSNPSGTINNPTGAPGTTEYSVTMLSIFDDESATMLAGVTNLQFDFYAVDNTQGQMRDPFDGVNPFTGEDDGLTAAFVAPLLWEIDVLGSPAAAANADFNGDGQVDGADYLIWQRGLGGAGATLAQGDANGDSLVNEADLAVWRGQFTPTASMTPLPEPAAGMLAIGLAAALAAMRRRVDAR